MALVESEMSDRGAKLKKNCFGGGGRGEGGEGNVSLIKMQN